MPKHVIVLSIDRSGNLHLSDGDTTNVGNVFNRNIFWEKSDTRIESFIIVGKETDGPFGKRDKMEYDTAQHLKVNLFAKTNDWKYAIDWKDSKTHTVHHYDPIISIKPVIASDNFVPLFIILLVGFVGVPMLLLRRNRIRKRNKK